MTDIQIIGSHNSYHSGLGANELAMMRKANPRAAESLEYTHPPLLDQLNMGVRKFELDIFADSKGGLFADPLAPKLVEKAGLPADPPFDPQGKMKQPGYKVIHVLDYDYRSSCQPLKECFAIVRDWSKAHPTHLPIYFLLETKTGKTAEPMTIAALEALEAEILEIFSKDHIITPDKVRGNSKTLEEAVLNKGWPSLKEARGKVVFLFDQENITPLYTKGHPNLEGRLIFTNSTPGTPDAAFIKENNALSPRIAELVKKGYLVRTMSDGGVAAVKANDTKRKDAALASGAHIVSTDYYFNKRHESGYHVTFDKGVARCNPVKAPACDAKALVD
jgi:hypothetical protein